MHEPNSTKFPAPESHVGFIKHTWDDPKLDLTFQHLINKHPFNSKVNVLLPGSPSCPQRLKRTLSEDTEFYHVENVPLAEFCTPVFLQAFLNTGKVYAVSCDTRLDLDNVASLTPDGWLILLLDKFTYHELRLSGKLSAHILRRPKERYVVKVNLKDNFIPGKPYYNKVVKAFKEVPLRFTFWITWLPNDVEVCPSSIAKYFSDGGYEIVEQQIYLKSDIMPEADVPILTDYGDEPGDILEWIGCHSLGIRLLLLEETCEEIMPWVSVTVYGHVDSPVTWGLTENSYYANGDNFYTLIVMRNNLWCYKVSGSRKPLRMFEKCNNNK